MVKLSEASALDRRVVVCTGEWDYVFFSGISIENHVLESWRDDFVVLGQ